MRGLQRVQERSNVSGCHHDVVIQEQNKLPTRGLDSDVVGFSKIEILIEFDQPGAMKIAGAPNNRLFIRLAAIVDNDDLVFDPKSMGSDARKTFLRHPPEIPVQYDDREVGRIVFSIFAHHHSHA